MLLQAPSCSCFICIRSMLCITHCTLPMQISGGRLPLDQARKTLAGLGPVLPTPALAGLEQYGLPGVANQPGQSYAPQVTGGYQAQHTGGAASYVAQGTGGSQQAGYAPQHTGGYVAQTTGGYVAQVTGGGGGAGYAAQVTGGSSAYVAQTTGGYVAQTTGGYVAQTTGGLPAPAAVGYAGEWLLQLLQLLRCLVWAVCTRPRGKSLHALLGRTRCSCSGTSKAALRANTCPACDASQPPLTHSCGSVLGILTIDLGQACLL